MIFHDTVTLVISVNGVDQDGYPTSVESTTEGVPAEVIPLSSDLAISADRNAVISRYRIVLSPTVEIPVGVGTGLRVGWGDYTIDPDYSLTVDGAVERHYLRGRLHHYELVTKSVT